MNRPWQHLYDTRRWRKQSALFKIRNPLCVYCLQVGKTTRADLVDHIVQHLGDIKLFWDKSNWQALCKQCHDSVKAKEESRGYAVGCDVDGMPVGVHPWNEE